MTVTVELLSALVSAHENQQKFTELKRELIRAGGLNMKPRAYRFCEYNIHVTPVPFRATQVTILQAPDLTPQPETDAANDTTGAEDDPFSSRAYGATGKGVEVPGDVEGAERRAVNEVLDILSTRFYWNASSKGRAFWVELTNKLRAVVGERLLNS